MSTYRIGEIEASSSPSAEFRFFLYDPAGDGHIYFATVEDRDSAAKSIIQDYLDDGWSEEVEGVVAGELTHDCQQVNRQERPDDLTGDGYDAQGGYWPVGWDYTCRYELMPLKDDQDDEQPHAVLAEGFFHALPDEDDYEFFDIKQGADENCADCIPVAIVRKSCLPLLRPTGSSDSNDALKRVLLEGLSPLAKIGTFALRRGYLVLNPSRPRAFLFGVPLDDWEALREALVFHDAGIDSAIHWSETWLADSVSSVLSRGELVPDTLRGEASKVFGITLDDRDTLHIALIDCFQSLGLDVVDKWVTYLYPQAAMEGSDDT